MKISICDLCNIDGKMVKSDYRWGYKGGFKLDLCKFHVDKKNNPFTGMRQEEAQKKFFDMMYKDKKNEKPEPDLTERLHSLPGGWPKT